MERSVAVWGFVIAGVLFLAVGVMRLLRGGSIDATMFLLGIVFLVLGLTVARRPPGEDRESGEG